MEYLSYLLLGACAGVVAGLLGVGGGLVIVPMLLIIFDRFAVVDEKWMAHVAIATSLATIIITALSAIRAQQKRKAIDWGLLVKMVPGVLAGSLLGASLAGLVPKSLLLSVFAVFLLLVAAKMWWQWRPPVLAEKPALKWRETLPVSATIGVLSALLGIGGGTMTVPYLNSRGVIIHRAIAVSTTLGLPIAIAGTIGFSSLFYSHSFGQQFVGLIYWPAFLLISAMTLLTAPLGVALLHYLDKEKVTRLFALFLLFQVAVVISKVF